MARRRRTTAAYTPQPAVTAWQQEQRQKAAAGAAPSHLYAARAPATGELRTAQSRPRAESNTEQVTVSADQLEAQAQRASQSRTPPDRCRCDEGDSSSQRTARRVDGGSGPSQAGHRPGRHAVSQRGSREITGSL